MRKLFYLPVFLYTFFAFTGNVVAQFADSTLFNYSGGTATFTVPSCVTSITIKAWGAGGGGGGSDGNPGGAGGGGAYSSGILSVTTGEVLTISVGGGGGVGGNGASGNYPGPAGYGYGSGGTGGTAGSYGSSGSGGGGGGGTFLLNGSTIVVAAGGGGGGGGAGNIGSPIASGPGGGGGGQNGFTLNYGAGGAAGASGNNNGTSGTARNGQDGGNAGAGGGGYQGGLVGAQPNPGIDGSGGGGGGGSSFGTTIVNGNAATPGYNTYSALPSGCALGGAADASYGSTAGNGFLIIEYYVAITASASSTGTSCYGSTDGTVSVVANGNAPFTYSWSDAGSQTNATATGLSAGTYTVTVHDVNGCSTTASAIVTQPTQILFQSTATQSFSYTGAVQNWVVPAGTVSATITATGGGGGSCFRGDGGPGATLSAVFTSLTPGDNISFVVGEAGHDDYNSYGGGGGGGTFVYDSNSVNLFLVAAGGGGGGAYNNGKSGGLDYSGFSPNDDTYDGGGGSGGSGGNGAMYAVSPYDGAGGAGWLGNGANGSNSYGGNDMSNGFYGGPQDNNGDGNAGGYGGGGGGGYSSGGGGGGYNGGGGGNDYTYISYSRYSGGGGGGGSYLNGGTITGTPVASNSGADGSASIEYTINNNPVTTQNAGCGSNGIITAGVPNGGTPPYTYNWTPSGGTDLTASGLSAGTYTLTATDSKGCTQTASSVVTGSSIVVNASVTSNVLCYNGNNGSALSSPTGGIAPYTYLWSDATSATTASVSNLSAGSYTVTVSDSTSCSVTASLTITQPVRFIYISAGVISNVTCNGGNNGHVNVTSVGGSSPYTYAWNNGTTTVSTIQSPNTLSAGSYTITVTDNCGVSKTSAVNLTQPNDMRDSVSAQTNIMCGGGNGGRLTIGAKGGTFPYHYLWSTGSTLVTITGLSAGTFSIVITDKNGCTNSVSGIAVTQPNPLIATIGAISYPACNGEHNGSANLNVSGGTIPYTYSWTSNVSTTASAANLPAASYTVSIKDAHGCTTSIVVSITQPGAIRDSAVKALTVNVACNGGNSGSITMGTKNGTAPYNYLWSPNNSCTTATASGLSAGTYLVGVEDANGCSSSFSTITITQPPTILRDSVSLLTGVGCFGGSGGQASIGVRGGATPYTYAWSNGKTTYTNTGLTAGTYSVVVTDKAGCSIPTTGITVTQPAAAITSTIPTPTCVGGGRGTVTINVSGGTASYRYAWSNGNTNSSMTVNSGTYHITVSDAHGCNTTNAVTFSCGPVIARKEGDDYQPETGCCATLDNITLYPNPNTGQFTLAGLEQGMTVEMYDYTGRKINSQLTVANAQLIINVSDQPNGIYLIRILDKDGNLVNQKKVVKTN